MASNWNRLLKKSLALAIGLALADSAFMAAQATTVTTWIAGDGSWDNVGNWSAGVPDPSLDAVISPTATPVVVSGPVSSSTFINSLILGGPQNATLRLDSSSLEMNNAIVESNGYLSLIGNHALVTGSLLVNGTIDISGTTVGTTLPGLEGGGTVLLGNQTLVLSNAGGTFAGAIHGGSGGLTVAGGFQILAGTATYAGLTSVEGANLTLGNDHVLDSASSLQVTGGGAFDLGGHNQTLAQLVLVGGGIANGNLESSGHYEVQAGTVSANLGGSAGLAKNTDGFVILSGVNTYTGLTEVNGGYLALQGGQAIADSGAVKVGEAGIFKLFESASEGGPLLASSGPTANSETIGSLNGVAGSQVWLNDNTLTTDGATDPATPGVFAGSISGTGGLTKEGAGTLILAGSNSYTGATTVNGGSLVLDLDNALDSASSLVVNGGTFDLGGHTQTFAQVQLLAGAIANGNLESTSDYDVRAGTVSANLGGAVGLVKSTDGSVVLSGTNTYTGSTSILGGTLALGADNTLPTASPLTVDGGSLDLGGHSQTLAQLRLLNGNIDNGNLESTGAYDVRAGAVSANLGGAVGLVKSTDGFVILSGVNTYTGLTEVSEGYLALQGGQAIADSGAVKVGAAGIFKLLESAGEGPVLAAVGPTANSETIGSLNGVAGSQVWLNDNTLTTGGATDPEIPDVFAGSISGTGGLTKEGAGNLILSGNNSYTGATTVNGGSLILGVDDALADASSLVVNGGTFDSGGYSQTLAQVHLLAGAIVNGRLRSASDYDIRSGTVSARLGGAGGLVKSTEGTATLNTANVYTGPTTVGGGTLALGVDNALLDTSSLTVDGGSFDLGGHSQTLAQVKLIDGSIVNGNLSSASDYDVRSGTVSANLGGTVGLVKSTDGTVTLNSVNSYTGPTTVSGGTLALGMDNALAAGSTLTVDGGSFDLGGHSQALAQVKLIAGAIANGNLSSASDYDVRSGTVSANLGGTVGLVKSTDGTVILNNANSYTGPTTVSGGSLALGMDNALAAGSTLTVDGGTFDLGGHSQTLTQVSLQAGSIANGNLNSTGDYEAQSGSISANLGGAAGLAKTTGGTVILSGTNTYTGTTTVSGGVLQLQGGQAIADAGRVDVGAAGVLELLAGETVGSLQGAAGGQVRLNAHTLTVAGSGDASFAGVISGGGGLAKQGAGSLTLSGANTYTGTTTVSGGVLQLQGGQAIADTGTVDVGAAGALELLASETVGSLQGAAGGQVRLNAHTLTVAGSGDASFAGVISGGGGLAKQGAGSLTLAGANSYTGPTTVSGGTLALGMDNALAAGSTLTIDGGTFDLGGHSQTLTQVSLQAGSIANGNLNSTGDYEAQSGSISANLGGAAGLAKTTGGTVILSGVNTYTGTTTVSGGVLQLQGEQAIADAGRVDVGAAGVLELLAGETVGSLQGAAGGQVRLNAHTLTVAGGGDASFAGVISGGGGLVKQGAGSLTLSGANSYTGTTTVSGGVLQLQGGQAIADAGTVDVGAAGALELLAGETIGGLQGTAGGQVRLNAHTLTVAGGGDASFAGNISGSGGLAKQGAGSLTLAGANSYTGPTTVGGGNLILGMDNALNSASSLVVNGGTFDLGGHSQTLTQVSLQAGSIANGNLNSTGDYDIRSGTASANLGGAAGLAKTTGGTAILGGANTYTGTTTVSGGVLQLQGGQAIADAGRVDVGAAGVLELLAGEAVGSLQGAAGGQVRLNAHTLTVAGGGDASFAGVISGGGGLVKQGAGRLILTGSNSYSGDTTINAGVLQLGDGGNTGSLSGNVLNNGSLVFNRSNDIGFAGTITGSGNLLKLGAGTLNLTNTVNLAQAIRVDGGGLAIGGTATAGSLVLGSSAGSKASLSLEDGASLAVGTETVGGAGQATVTHNGGTHTITSTLDLGVGGSGVYTLNGGQLVVGSQITVGSGNGVLNVAGGSLQAASLNNLGSFNYAGGTVAANLTNQGTVTLSGAGTRTLTGDVNNQGVFKVSETTAVYTGDFSNNGAYLSDPASSQFHNLSVGPNGYLAGGAGDQFIVTGNFNNASSQGTLWDTSQAALVFTNPAGGGSTGHTMQLAGADKGALAAGAANNFAWGSVTLSSGNRLLLADGNTTPGAALYTSRVKLPGGVSELANISSDYNVYYDPTQPDNAYLQGNTHFGNGSGQLLPWSFVPFAPTREIAVDPLLTSNEKSFAGAVNEACASPSAAMRNRCAQLQGLDAQQQRLAIASLTPDQTPGQTLTPINFTATRMDNTLFSRLASLRHGSVSPLSFNINGVQLPTEHLAQALGLNSRGGAAGDLDGLFRDGALGVYLQTRFNLGNLGSNPWARSFEFQGRNVTAGADYRFSDNFIAGMAFNYNNISTQYEQSSGSLETDNYTGSLYASYYLPEDFHVDGLLSYGGSNHSSTRRYAYAGFVGQAYGKLGGDQFNFALNGGKDFHWQEWTFTPYLRLEYLTLHIDGYQEQGGGGFAMTVGGQTNASFVHDLGFQLSHALSLPFGVVTPSLRFEWEHQYLNDNRSIQMRLSDAKPGIGYYNIDTGQPDRDYFNLGGSVSMALPNGGAGFIRYETRLGQSYISEHIVEAGVRLTF